MERNKVKVEKKKELLIRALKNRASIYEVLGRYENSLSDINDALKFCRKHISHNKLKIAELNIDLADRHDGHQL